jgi:hypothetical protein
MAIREDLTTQIRKIEQFTARENSGKPSRELEPEVEARSEMRRLGTVPKIRRYLTGSSVLETRRACFA